MSTFKTDFTQKHSNKAIDLAKVETNTQAQATLAEAGVAVSQLKGWAPAGVVDAASAFKFADTGDRDGSSGSISDPNAEKVLRALGTLLSDPTLQSGIRPPSGPARSSRVDLGGGVERGIARREFAKGEVGIVPADLRDVMGKRSSDKAGKPTKTEEKLLGYDFYDSAIKLGAKGNSTNAGVLVMDATPRNEPGEKAHKVLAKLKMSISQTPCNTSSILAYPQLARLLGVDAEVPPAIIRSISIETHKPIYEKGLSTAIARSWQQFPAIYNGTSRDVPYVVTQDGTHLFGALSKNPTNEKAYGAFNGPMRGVPYENRYPQSVKKGAAFQIVSSSKPLSAQFGGSRDLKVVAQKTQWARDMADMFVLDALLNQQDRPGNIASHQQLAYVDGARARLIDPDDATPAQKAAGALVDVLMLKDNDGGVSLRGSPRPNRTRAEQMLEQVRHMNPDTYKAVLELRDRVNQEQRGTERPIQDYFTRDLLFSERDYAGGPGSFVDNVNYVASLLERKYRNRELHLDADLAIQTGLRSAS